MFRAMSGGRRPRDEEEEAAQAIQRVIGGVWEVTDTGKTPRQVDVMIDVEDGRRVAVEVTSRVDFEVRAAGSAIRISWCAVSKGCAGQHRATII